METESTSLIFCKMDINSEGTVIQKKIKIEPAEYTENFEQPYKESGCLYTNITLSEVDPLNVECKQEISEEYIIKDEKVEINVEPIRMIMDINTSVSTVGGK